VFNRTSLSALNSHVAHGATWSMTMVGGAAQLSYSFFLAQDTTSLTWHVE
jgi:hypothetical protein